MVTKTLLDKLKEANLIKYEYIKSLRCILIYIILYINYAVIAFDISKNYLHYS